MATRRLRGRCKAGLNYPASRNQSRLTPQWRISPYQLDPVRSVIPPNRRLAGNAAANSMPGLHRLTRVARPACITGGGLVLPTLMNAKSRATIVRPHGLAFSLLVAQLIHHNRPMPGTIDPSSNSVISDGPYGHNTSRMVPYRWLVLYESPRMAGNGAQPLHPPMGFIIRWSAVGPAFPSSAAGLLSDILGQLSFLPQYRAVSSVG